MIASLDFRVSFFCLTLCKLCTRHTSCTIFCSSSNFDPTFKVAPLKYMLIFFDLPSTINGHLPNHHHLHSNWIFACYNFLQYTAHAHTLFFLVGRSVGRGIVGAAHLIWFLFVCYLFIDCYLLFLVKRPCSFGAFTCNGWINLQRRKKFLRIATCPSMTLFLLTVGKSFINHFPCVSALSLSLFIFLSVPLFCCASTSTSTSQQWASEQFSVMYVQNKHTQGTGIFCHY